ncbi:MAG: hypothetical protein IJ104_07805 [Methanobrevibacter sp.]|nr:hypothetical protein [Methanobrevibacter sp.]
MDKRFVFILFFIIIITIPISFASDDINFTANTDFEENYYNNTVNEIDNNQFNGDDVNFEKNFSTSSQENDSSNNRGNTIIHDNLVKYYGNSNPFTITILDSNNVGVSGISITFNVNGQNYLRTTNSLGVASLAINLNSGTYDAYTTINDFSVTYHRYITILPTIIGNDIIKYYKNGTQYHATFYDTSGNLLTNTDVTFNINGVIYNRVTNSEGIASLNINLNPGNYVITSSYGDLFIGNTIIVN